MNSELDKSTFATDHNSDFPVSYDQGAVAERFREVFRSAGGNTAVARRAGVAKGTLNNLLAGTDVGLSRAFALAQACGVSLDWLVTGIGPRESPWSPGAQQRRRTHHRMDGSIPDNQIGNETRAEGDNSATSPYDDSSGPETSPGLGQQSQNGAKDTMQHSRGPPLMPHPIIPEILAQAIEIIQALDVVNGLRADPRELADRITTTYGLLIGAKP